MGKQLVKFSATSIDTFLSCRRKYYYSKILNIQPVERPDALDFGSAVHRGIGYLLNAMRNDDSEKEVVRQYALDQINQYADEYCMNDESRCKALALLDSYIDLYFDNDKSTYEVLDVEKYFEQIISEQPGTDFVTHGYFDAVVKEKSTDRIFVIEHKTTGMMSDDYLSKSHFDTQVMIYMNACKSKYGRCDGVIYDVLSKPRHVMSLGETDEEFEARKAASKTGRIKRKEAETKEQFIRRMQASFKEDTFIRELIEYDETKLTAFNLELNSITRNIFYCDCYYRCTGNCLKYGACPYIDLCSDKVTVDNLGDKLVNCDKQNEED